MALAALAARRSSPASRPCGSRRCRSCPAWRSTEALWRPFDLGVDASDFSQRSLSLSVCRRWIPPCWPPRSCRPLVASAWCSGLPSCCSPPPSPGQGPELVLRGLGALLFPLLAFLAVLGMPDRKQRLLMRQLGEQLMSSRKPACACTTAAPIPSFLAQWLLIRPLSPLVPTDS